MDPTLLTKALNHHGQELLRAMEVENKDQLRGVDLRSVDYHDYHKRAREFQFKDRHRRMKLFRFIGKKARYLYTPPNINHVIPVTWDADNEDLCAVMPPFESFMSVPKIERRHHFMQNLKNHDMVVGQVIERYDHGVFVRLSCMDGGKKREIHDIRIKVGCRAMYSGCDDPNFNVLDEFQLNDYIRAKVTEVDPVLEKIKISMLSEFRDVKMGVIKEEEVPAHHKNYLKHQGKTYEQVLEQILGFSNPATVSHMCKLCGLPPNHFMSFMTVLNGAKYPKEEYAVELRKAQSAKWACQSVRDGVAFFKAGQQEEAFLCLNKALQVYPESVEALMARGTLFANNNNLKRAIEDFERVLETDPNHVNGKKYVSETLVALGQNYEDQGDTEEATKMYQRAIQRNPDNTNAKDALIGLEMREEHKKVMSAAKEQQHLIPAPQPPRTQEPLVSHPYDTRENLKTQLQEEKHPKRTRSSPDEKAEIVHQKRMRDEKGPQGYLPHQQHDREEAIQNQGYRPQQQNNRQEAIQHQGSWPQQQQNPQIAIQPQGYWPQQQNSNGQNAMQPQGYWPHQQQNIQVAIQQNDNRQGAVQPPGYWPHQQQNIQMAMQQNVNRPGLVQPQGCWPQQQQNIQEAIPPQAYWPNQKDDNREQVKEPPQSMPQQQVGNIEEKTEPRGSRSSARGDRKKKKSSSSSSSSISSSSSSSSPRSSSSSSIEILTPTPAQPPPKPRPPSPKILFVMRKDEDTQYSKYCTHSAFLEDDDEDDDQPTSAKGSKAGPLRSKGKIGKQLSSTDKEGSHRSEHSRSEDEPREGRHRSRDRSPPSRHYERYLRQTTDSRDRHSRERSSERTSPSGSSSRLRSKKEATSLISRAPDLEDLNRMKRSVEFNRREGERLKRLQWEENVRRTTNMTAPTPSPNLISVPLIRPAVDGVSKALAVAAHINAAFHDVPAPPGPTPVKLVVPTLAKNQISSEDKSVIAMKAFLEKLKAEKKPERVTKPKIVWNNVYRKKP